MNETNKPKALIMGVANDRSLAWSITKTLHAKGFEIALSYLDERLLKRVAPLAEELGIRFLHPCDVGKAGDLEALFAAVRERWGHLNALVHSLAFAKQDELQGQLTGTSREGFRVAMDISVFSFIESVKLAEPLMTGHNASILTLTFGGSQRVVPNYNIMGVAKAALEASVRYLASDLGPKKIRVNALSAGPVKTLAAAGIRDFREMLGHAEECSPLRENISGDDVGNFAAFLLGNDSTHVTGGTHYVDSGLNIVGA